MNERAGCVIIKLSEKAAITFATAFTRGSKGFDRGLAAGEAIRCDTLIAKININAEDNLAYAA